MFIRILPEVILCPVCKDPLYLHDEREAYECADNLGYSRNDEGAK